MHKNKRKYYARTHHFWAPSLNWDLAWWYRNVYLSIMEHAKANGYTGNNFETARAVSSAVMMG